MSKNQPPKYSLNANGEFLIENYNHAKPFANFFPGIAGKYGIPMWVFYVNRGQGIVSFGTKDKDHAILEFFPANKAWQLVSTYGFRTFIKITSGREYSFYEPFQNGLSNRDFKLKNLMRISSHNLLIEEDNLTLGIKTKIEYSNIPNDSYAGLARIITITNTGRSRKKIQLLDGLPQIVPFGTGNLFLKKLGRTIEAWMKVKNLEKEVPFYKIDVDPTDRPEVLHIKEGNFYLAFDYKQDKPRIIKPIVDPECIFGSITDFSYPERFLSKKNFGYPQSQIRESKTPCGFLLANLELSPNKAKTIYSVTGYMASIEQLNSSIQKIINPGYLDKKTLENADIIQELQKDIKTQSSSPEFDFYCQQTYLDNIIRGGYPVIFKTKNQQSAFYLYSRKHGDLERDYNKFLIQPTYFSQGNGNYRDVNQNRRSDTWFNPEIQDENIITFFNLLQADGFNPLVVKGLSFKLTGADNLKNKLPQLIGQEDIAKLLTYLEKPFTPGELLIFIEQQKINLKVSCEEFLSALLENSLKNQEAEHGEGFWTDHWHYNLDLLENYLGVFPEKLREILFDKRIFTYFDNTETVRPRSEKYILQDGHVKQLHSVILDTTKRELIRKRTEHPHLMRANHGQGEIYQTTLVNKLICLLTNKLASLDPYGCGIEMEANKPNWFDALNGLPALFGSSTCETFELKRLIVLIIRAIKSSGIEKISISGEICEFLTELDSLLRENSGSTSLTKDFEYWDKSCGLKESFRHKTRLGFEGREIEIESVKLNLILEHALEKVNTGIAKSLDAKQNIYYSYFFYEVKDYQPLNDHYVKPLKFTQNKLPFFLESQMHALRINGDFKKAKALYQATKISQLFDKKLKMYKVTASLSKMPQEIGRCRVFSPGWLENESIWLHMEYKYILEALKNGLYEEFYEDFKNVLIPFQKAKNYGRNILENSSFLVSSAFPDKNLHGNGFVARLSGSTAELLSIWLIMNTGHKPFFLNAKNELNLKFNPLLAGWLFARNGQYSFNFLSKVKVTFHNPKRKNTFGSNAAKPEKIIFQDTKENLIELNSDTIPSPYALQIRSRKITAIDVYFV